MDTDIKQKNQYLNWLDSLAAATFVIDSQHQVIFWNRACEVLTAVKSETVPATNRHWSGFYESERPCLADLTQLLSEYNENISPR